MSSEKRPYEKETSVDLCGKFTTRLLYNTELQKLGNNRTYNNGPLYINKIKPTADSYNK